MAVGFMSGSLEDYWSGLLGTLGDSYVSLLCDPVKGQQLALSRLIIAIGDGLNSQWQKSPPSQFLGQTIKSKAPTASMFGKFCFRSKDSAFNEGSTLMV